MMMFPNLTLSIAERIAVLTIDHPPANALNQETFRGLTQAFAALETDDSVKVILLTGAGRFFVAGADIKEFAEYSSEQAQALSAAGQQVFERIAAFSKPVIAVINGACLGGGLELAMACHIRLVAEEAKLGLPELNLGLIPGYAGTQRLPRLIGKGMATRLLLTSELLTGAEAYRLGLAEGVYPAEQLSSAATQLAQAIAQKSAVAMRLVLEAVRVGWEQGEKAGAAHESVLFGAAFGSADMREGVRAFLEKRQPQFQDR